MYTFLRSLSPCLWPCSNMIFSIAFDIVLSFVFHVVYPYYLHTIYIHDVNHAVSVALNISNICIMHALQLTFDSWVKNSALGRITCASSASTQCRCAHPSSAHYHTTAQQDGARAFAPSLSNHSKRSMPPNLVDPSLAHQQHQCPRPLEKVWLAHALAL